MDTATRLEADISYETIKTITNHIASFHEHYTDSSDEPFHDMIADDLEQLDAFTLLAIVAALKA
jgi:hypothetical protein